MKKFYLFFGFLLAALITTAQAQAITVYYNNPNNWETVKAYFYKGSANNEWPGAAMTKEGNLYKIDVPAAYAEGQVIFNNGSGAQYPAALGKQLAGKSMICWQDKNDDNNSLWNEYQDAPFKVFFDNSTANWSTVHVYYFGKTTVANWDNSPTATQQGSTKVYEYEVPAGTAGVIFHNGSGAQTPNFNAIPDHKYNQTTDLGADVPVGDPFVVYWDNSDAKWEQPKAHYYGGLTASEWPGADMTQLPGKKVWQITIAAGTTGLVFNNGNGSQSGDLDAKEGHIYNLAGDQGVYDPDAPVVVSTPEHLYILGNVGETDWATTPGIELTKSGNTFTATGITIKQATVGADKSGYFTLVSAVGADWNAVNAADRFGAATENAELTSGTAAPIVKYETGVNASSAYSWKIPAGKYNVVVNFEDNTITLTRTDQDIVAVNGALSIPDITIQPNKDATMEIVVTAEKPMKALQLDIEVPDCVTAGAPLISRSMADHQLSSSIVNGKIRVVVFSEGNAAFSAADGTLLYLPLTAKADAEVGDYQIKLTNIVFSDENLLKVKPADVTGKLTVEAVGTGSVTLDKTVLALSPGETATLTATVLPEDAAVKTVTWTTSNADVATVNNGLVTAKANGSAIITASCNGVSATCTVYVGKKAQTITWDQEIAKLGINDEVTFTATSSSGVPVTYTITNGNAFAELTDNTLTAKGVGLVTVEARAAGNDEYAPAEPVSKTITIWLGYLLGDVDGSSSVQLADATATVQHILGTTPANFNEAAADVNGDDDIDVVDVSLIVNIILEQSAQQPSHIIAKNAENSNLEQFAVQVSDYALRISFTNMNNYVAAQFDIVLPEGVTIENAVMAGGTTHRVSFLNKENNTARVVVLSMQNDNFASNGYINLFLSQNVSEGVTIFNALVNSLNGNDVIQNKALGCSVETSAVNSVVADGVNENCSVYTVDGVCVYNGNIADFKAQKGLYIIRTASKVQKLMVR